MRPPINRMKKCVIILLIVSPIFIWSNTITTSQDTQNTSWEDEDSSFEQVTVLIGNGTLENDESKFKTFNLNCLFMDPGEYVGDISHLINMGLLLIHLIMVVLDPFMIDNETIPLNFAIINNYSNPFNPFTLLSISVSEWSLVNVLVNDMIGRKLQYV